MDTSMLMPSESKPTFEAIVIYLFDIEQNVIVYLDCVVKAECKSRFQKAMLFSEMTVCYIRYGVSIMNNSRALNKKHQRIDVIINDRMLTQRRYVDKWV